MKGNLYIHAPNVHQGGGSTLLSGLLAAWLQNGRKVYVQVDTRMALPGDLSDDIKVTRIPPSLSARFRAEFRLFTQVKPSDVVLCFGNLPPLFRLRSRVFIFLQNRYLIERIGLRNFTPKERARIRLERLWLASRLNDEYDVIVQTPNMQRLLLKNLGRESIIVPFVEDYAEYLRRIESPDRKEKGFNFLYVASAEPHKNHRRLIKAWAILAQENLFPNLCLTIKDDSEPDLMEFIDQVKKEHSLRITNSYAESPIELNRLYEQSDALIYPSTLESFGLPLIEARAHGLPVIASELDFVRDVVDPEESFDPASPVSIARAVKRYMGVRESALSIVSAEKFIYKILDEEGLE